MPVPTVSPHNWQRTRIICSFRMGTALSVADKLSFEDQLLTIIDSEAPYREGLSEIKEENRDSDTFSTHSDFQATPDEPYRVRQRTEQTEPHRPNVSEAVVSQLHEAVKREKPQIPAEKFDFDTNLTTVLDAAERYYEALQCEVEVVRDV